jgi:cytochrome P450
MTAIDASIPRIRSLESFLGDPLDCLTHARAELGNLFVVKDEASVFSGAGPCSGVVAVFGEPLQRAVLSDAELFGMPPSASHLLDLPANLANLNRSLHSMRGAAHQSHRHLIALVLAEFLAECDQASLWPELEQATKAWRAGRKVGLFREMRRLGLRLATKAVLGKCTSPNLRLANLLRTYFHLRREASSPAAGARAIPRELLLATGEKLDRELNDFVRASGRNARGRRDGLVRMLSQAAADRMSEDELIGHTSILFTSVCEPIAVGLTWTLLVLSQLPELRRRLRMSSHDPTPGIPGAPNRSLSLTECVLNESLRLLPPNAVMVRTMRRTGSLGGTALPAGCEVVLCPYVAHRDETVFTHARRFDPSRWIDARFSQYEYLPFGAGTHSCVGRGLATHLMVGALGFLAQRFEIVLAKDQAVDWRLHVQFMPRNDPSVFIAGAGSPPPGDGKLRGPVGDMLDLAIAGVDNR